MSDSLGRLAHGQHQLLLDLECSLILRDMQGTGRDAQQAGVDLCRRRVDVVRAAGCAELLQQPLKEALLRM